MPYLTLTATLAQDENFRNRLTAALVQGSILYAAQPLSTDDPEQAAQQARQQQLVLGFVNEPWNYVSRFAWIVASDDTVINQYAVDGLVGDVTDKAIEDAVRSGLAILGRV